MNPEEIANLICEDVSEKPSDAMLNSKRFHIILRKNVFDTALNDVLSMLHLHDSKNSNFNGDLLKQIEEQWNKVRPKSDVYNISAASRGTNDFREVGIVIVNGDSLRIKLNPQLEAYPDVAVEIVKSIKKFL